MRNLHISLYMKAMLLLGSVTTLLYTILICYNYTQIREEKTKEFATRMELQGRILAKDLAEELWDFNTSYIHSSISSILDVPEVSGVEIRDADGNIIEKSTTPSPGSEATEDHSFFSIPIEYKVGNQHQLLGSLKLIVSKKLHEEQIARFLNERIKSAIISLIAQLLLLHIILRYLLKPMQSITRSMLDLAQGKPVSSLPYQNQHDEIGQMSRAIQSFRETAVQIDELMHEIETRRTLQKELETAKSQAEQSDAAKSQFLANMSHEIRTPMNGILGMAHLLQDTNPTDVQKELIATINHSAQNLLLLLNDILDLSKIEAGELALETVPFDIVTEFSQSIRLFTPLAKTKNVTIATEISPTIPVAVISDPGRFSQIINNLIGNSVKFTEDGSIYARLNYNHTTQQIYCEIEDTGMGIPAHKQHLIFRKFTQGDASISRKFGGTGLGLAITKKLVMMMGGDITFTSEEGKGTCFRFFMPALPASAEDIAWIAENMCPVLSERLTADKVNILIAEDHPVNQILLVKLLKKFGFEHITIVTNGREALEQAHVFSPDLILMDCQMPEMDGYEATRQIRLHEKTTNPGKRSYIIAMTANAMVGDRETCLQAGMDEYISKPLSAPKLQEMLSQRYILPSTDTIDTTTSPNPPPAIDLERLSLIADTEEEQQEMLRLFFDLADQKLHLMRLSRRSDERIQWNEAVHYIKGSAQNLGMKGLSELCLKAEKNTDLNYNQATDLLSEIRDELNKLKSYFGFSTS